MTNPAQRKGRLAAAALIVASMILPSACDNEAVSPGVTETASLAPPKSSLTPERARAIITSRKPLHARQIPTPPDGISYAIDDGLSIANEVGILEGTMGGEQLELLFRMDPSGTLVDRITMVSNGEQIYAANIVYNGDGTASEVTQTAYYHESAGPTRRDISDPAGWGRRI